MENKKKGFLRFIIYLLVVLAIGMICIVCIDSVMAVSVIEGCEVDDDIVFCDCDNDCMGLNEICVTEITSEGIQGICDHSDTKINLAKRYESKLGFCGVVHSTIQFDDGTKTTKFFGDGTVYCPLKKVPLFVKDTVLQIPTVNESIATIEEVDEFSKLDKSFVSPNFLLLSLLVVIALLSLFILFRTKKVFSFCPLCKSSEVYFLKKLDRWKCGDCGNSWRQK